MGNIIKKTKYKIDRNKGSFERSAIFSSTNRTNIVINNKVNTVEESKTFYK